MLINTLTSLIAKLDAVDVTAAADGGAIFMYHTVGEPYPNRPALPEGVFRDHIQYLVNNYNIVDFRRLLDPNTNVANCVSLTFDGGYADFHSTILPILREYDVPSTVFVVPERIGRTNGQPPTATKWVDWFDFMSADQMREIINEPLVHVGNKTQTHANPLPELTDNELEREIVKGKEQLEERFGLEIDSFCYPRGRFDERTLDIVEDHHKYAVITRPDFVNKKTDLVRIPRFTADWRTAEDLRRMLTDRYVLEHNFRRIVKI